MGEPDVRGLGPAAVRTPPLASSVTVPDPTEVPVQVLEAVKNVNVTVPVGVPKLPLTVALSCTVDPAGTDVTRSEERRVGKEGRSRWGPYHYKENHRDQAP